MAYRIKIILPTFVIFLKYLDTEILFIQIIDLPLYRFVSMQQKDISFGSTKSNLAIQDRTLCLNAF